MGFLDGINALPKYRLMKIVKRLALSIKKIRPYAIIKQDSSKLAIMLKRTLWVIEVKNRATLLANL